MKIVTIVGARPQFIKTGAVSRVIDKSYKNKIEEVIVHTGQHYDNKMSDIFFKELEIPVPKYNLKISDMKHGKMTGRMIESIEEILLSEKPNWVLVYGDTNSTLAASIAAAKLYIPIAHVEAGLRSFNQKMPEEINRIVTDRVSSLLFCPTETAVNNLHNEGVKKGINLVGDVMFDIAIFYKQRAFEKSSILETLNLKKQKFVLATCHRAENTENLKKLIEILSILETLTLQFDVVIPLHPRTLKIIKENNLFSYLKKLKVTEPLSFFDFLALEQSAKFIITDSGGIQKEAFFYRTPCITLRNETEWTETIDLKANILVGTEIKKVLEIISKFEKGNWKPNFDAKPYGDGIAAKKILEIISSQSERNPHV